MQCLNEGICSKSNGSCICSNGFYGDSCELFNYCWNSPCMNSAKCIPATDSFTCKCTNEGYNGTLCQNCKYYIIFKNIFKNDIF